MFRREALLFSIIAAIPAMLAAPLAVGAKKPDMTLDVSLCAPDQNTFTTTINNSYFPLPVGQQWVYQGKEQGQRIGLQITVLTETETLYSGRNAVTTRIIEETEWEDGNANGMIDDGENLIEISRNFFAQTQDGTVCYFGEEVDIYEGGQVVSHEGAWRADESGNAPGIFMPANPQVGMAYQQEIAPGVAEDQATIVRRGSFTVLAGTFADTLTVRDFNPLDGSRSTKVYAQGVGLIADSPLELIRY
jgi:hypothetical protein